MNDQSLRLVLAFASGAIVASWFFKRSGSDIKDGFQGAIGNTPLVRLDSLSRATGCDILVKLEYCNPGGSVKDRAARALVNHAVRDGISHIVEASAGNTGIALGLMSRALGLKCTITMPETYSKGKIAALQAILGKENLVLCPAVSKEEPGYFHTQAKKIAREVGGRYCDQFNSVCNYEAHRDTTAEEIWNQSGGRVDCVALSCGTGGTLSGVSCGLWDKGVKTIVITPQHARIEWKPIDNDDAGRDVCCRQVPWSCYELSNDVEKVSSLLEGIGSGAMYDNVARSKVVGNVHVNDEQALLMTRYLLKHEGFFVGGSSGLNVCGAVLLAKQLGPGHVVATVLCDSGTNYLEKHWGQDVLPTLGHDNETAGLDLSFLGL